jgi:hypothetical protein
MLTTRHYLSLPSESYTINDHQSTNLYRKRLRSWKQHSTTSKMSTTSSMLDRQKISQPKSTIYTYPMHQTFDQQSRTSSTILTESLTSANAFHSPSLPYQSMVLTDDIDHNQRPTLYTDDHKRKSKHSLSCESLSNRSSSIDTRVQLKNSSTMNTDQLSIDNLQLICTYMN